jgi:hypothetical protein
VRPRLVVLLPARLQAALRRDRDLLEIFDQCSTGSGFDQDLLDRVAVGLVEPAGNVTDPTAVRLGDRPLRPAPR